MKEEVKRLQDQETKEMEQELEAAKQRQKAIDDLDKGVSRPSDKSVSSKLHFLIPQPKHTGM